MFRQIKKIPIPIGEPHAIGESNCCIIALGYRKNLVRKRRNDLFTQAW